MKITARDIQMFVGGALALWGFYALTNLPAYWGASAGPLRLVCCLLTGLALPIGIEILRGRTSAVSWAEIYLWLTVIVGGLSLLVYFIMSPANKARLPRSLVPELLASVALLALLLWSRSRKFNNTPEP